MVTTSSFVKPFAYFAFLGCVCFSMLIQTLPAHAEISAVEQQKLDKDLVYQAFFGDTDKVMALIGQGANPNAVNEKGVSALSLAAQRKSEVGYGVVKALLGSGADKNGRDKNGQSPLFHAARVGNLTTVMTLLNAGADYYLTDNDGNVARNIAFTQGHKDVFEAMDQFVNDKRERILQEYAEKEAKLNELMAKKAAEQPALVGNTAPLVKAVEVPLDVERKVFNKTVYDLSYHAFSYQYWYMVKSIKLKTTLKQSDVLELMDNHKTEADKSSETLVKQYGADRKYALRIMEPSKNNITKQIDKMGSNITRKSNGVGEVKDAEKRCGDIADGWVIYAPEMPTKTEIVPVESSDEVPLKKEALPAANDAMPSSLPDALESSAYPATQPPSAPVDEEDRTDDKSPPQESL
jgi:hypothetical protein